MLNFTYDVPTKVHFGKGQISHLSELKESGNKVLLVYGGGSIKKTGIYDEVMSVLAQNGLQVFELNGVEPNPRIQTVRKGIEICRENGIDMVLAVGGGSTIDCSKVIAAGVSYEGDCWDIVENPSLMKSALPIYTVLTLAATGSEMDDIAVISDLTINAKKGTRGPLMAPKMSILDPTYTYTVSARQTASGTADIMSHTLENYFSNEEGAYLQCRMAEAILKTIVHYGPIACKQPDNYEARANLMWASSWAINGLVKLGQQITWSNHPIEHQLSAFYDVTHGEGLAVTTPYWMEFALDEKSTAKFAQYGRSVFDLQGSDEEVAKASIQATRDFFASMNLPTTLRQLGITEDSKLEIMAQHASKGTATAYREMSKEDILAILRKAF